MQRTITPPPTRFHHSAKRRWFAFMRQKGEVLDCRCKYQSKDALPAADARGKRDDAAAPRGTHLQDPLQQPGPDGVLSAQEANEMMELNNA